MGRFQLELPFSPSFHSIVVFFPVGLRSLSRHFQTCSKCYDNDKRHTEKNTTIEWDNGEKGNSIRMMEQYDLVASRQFTDSEFNASDR